jgi:NifU-like protein involved in Fe-S cluster formation
VQQLGWSVRACALGQACTGIVADHLAELDEATVLRVGALRAILKGEREDSDWPELAMFALVRDVPNRHGSALLPFEALGQLFERALAGVSGKSLPAGAAWPRC